MDDRQQAANEGGWQVATGGSAMVGDAMASGDGRWSLPPLCSLVQRGDTYLRFIFIYYESTPACEGYLF
jgi:hypothetical protein